MPARSVHAGVKTLGRLRRLRGLRVADRGRSFGCRDRIGAKWRLLIKAWQVANSLAIALN